LTESIEVRTSDARPWTTTSSTSASPSSSSAGGGASWDAGGVCRSGAGGGVWANAAPDEAASAVPTSRKNLRDMATILDRPQAGRVDFKYELNPANPAGKLHLFHFITVFSESAAPWAKPSWRGD